MFNQTFFHLVITPSYVTISQPIFRALLHGYPTVRFTCQNHPSYGGHTVIDLPQSLDISIEHQPTRSTRTHFINISQCCYITKTGRCS